MKQLNRIMISTALLALPLSALADNDHRGHGRHEHRAKHHRHYDHHRHHDHRPRYSHHEHHAYHDHAVRRERVYVPAVVQAPPPAYPQGVTIHGNVHVPF